ncbi:BtrH N-terminal domain-containing protein [Lutispora saccharofermentans]|uniref:BtrH N-terminal domain-containing protein n=1 Tax=Lutispora saccharofermentans TaxID=3024236 RepID=A0ABT1NIN6_9FIRM|nr:BtrH N-terminal domain-containing protein [Lutispora saccharofermentans]MCQ1531143.1 BtrH N-terminal domain-containing protein [Lutispora saccharofermentans]
MMLNITAKHDDACNCLEDLYMSVADWFHVDYELMYSEAWGFSYTQGHNLSETSLLSDLFRPGNGDRDALWQLYHGMAVTCTQPKSVSEVIDVICRELGNNKPVILYMDSFWCPWYKGRYQQFHTAHYCLITGINETHDVLYCVDGQNAGNGAELPVYNMAQGFGEYITFNKVEPSFADRSWQEIISDSMKRFNLSDNSIFDMLRCFAKDLVPKVDFNAELSQYKDNPFNAPLFELFLAIGRGRKQFAKSLQYLSINYNDARLMGFADRLIRAGDRWSSIFGMIIKSYYMNKEIEMLKKVAQKIEEAADDEERIASELREYAETGHTASKQIHLIKSHMPLDNDLKQYFSVDLTNYYNNKAFDEVYNDKITAELSNGGRFMLSDDIPKDRNWNIEHMKFLFPMIGTGVNDNISCNAQNIPIPSLEYNHLMLLGCSELGNHADYLMVAYKDGFTEQVPIELTSWLTPKPTFGECIALTGRGAVKNSISGNVDIYPFTVSIYAAHYALKHEGIIDSIKLPYCLNIHLFALTLGK